MHWKAAVREEVDPNESVSKVCSGLMGRGVLRMSSWLKGDLDSDAGYLRLGDQCPLSLCISFHSGLGVQLPTNPCRRVTSQGLGTLFRVFTFLTITIVLSATSDW